jgi:hypothetical protein
MGLWMGRMLLGNTHGIMDQFVLTEDIRSLQTNMSINKPMSID